MKRLIWLFVLVIIFVVLCQSAPAFALKISLGKISLGLEKEIGASSASQVEQEYGLVSDPEMVARVQNVATRLIAQVPRQDVSYQVKILNSEEFNAFALPGGYVYLNRGLLESITSDDELAFVIAHELTHISDKHGFNQLLKLMGVNILLGELGGGAKEEEIFGLAGQALMAKYSRGDETEADKKGQGLATNAGFNPQGGLMAMRRMETLHKEEPGTIERFLSSHPQPKDRSEYLKDFAIRNRYGQDFRKAAGGRLVLRQNSNPFTADLPIIVAHHSLWQSPLSVWNGVDGVGIFSPSPISNEQKDVEFYLNILRSGQFVSAVCDNDSHTSNVDERFTFVDSPNLEKYSLLTAIKEGRAYASVDGTRIIEENFQVGSSHPKVSQVVLRFGLVFPQEVSRDQKIIVYRDGEKLAEISPISSKKEKKIKEAYYQLVDSKAGTGYHWYLLYLKDKLITSPITVEVTGNKDDPRDFPSSQNWKKGIIHLHTKFSDGVFPPDSNWQEAQKEGVNFIFVTDHADCFGEGVGWHQTLTSETAPGWYHTPHLHLDSNPYQEYVSRCQWLSQQGSPLLIPGVEYPLSDYRLYRHLLVLGQETFLPYRPMTELEFFGLRGRGEFLLESGPVHLGDDTPQSQTIWMKEFELSEADLANRQEAVIRLQVKATPRKDPVISLNRQEVGRAVTEQNQWQTFEFRFDPKILRPGKNLVDLETVIPDLWQTFDECEFRELALTLR